MFETVLCVLQTQKGFKIKGSGHILDQLWIVVWITCPSWPCTALTGVLTHPYPPPAEPSDGPCLPVSGCWCCLYPDPQGYLTWRSLEELWGSNGLWWLCYHWSHHQQRRWRIRTLWTGAKGTASTSMPTMWTTVIPLSELSHLCKYVYVSYCCFNSVVSAPMWVYE